MTISEYLYQRITDLGGPELMAEQASGVHSMLSSPDDPWLEMTGPEIVADGYKKAIRSFLAARPRRYSDAHLGDLYDDQKGPDLARWLSSGRQNLVLIGHPGNGKTHVAHALMAEQFAREAALGEHTIPHRIFSRFHEYDAPCHLYRDRSPQVPAFAVQGTADLLQALDSWDKDDAEAAHFLATFTPVLALDDIDAADNSGKRRERLGQIVDERWRTGRKTIFTSNVKLEALAGYWSPRIADRIRDGVVLDFDGESRRTTLNL